MNVADAAHAVVHDYPGGSESLAPRLGMSAAILRGKVNPRDAGHHLTLAEADRMTAMTGDLRILHALAAAHDHVLVPVAGAEDGHDLAVLEVVAALWSRNGDLGQAVHHALSDGVLTASEMEVVRAAAYRLRAQIGALLGRLDAMAQPETEVPHACS